MRQDADCRPQTESGAGDPAPSRTPCLRGENPSEKADRFWEAEDHERAAARSAERADLALGLLARAGIAPCRLLDAGCGPGWTLERFAAAGFDARGADASPAAVALARGRGLAAETLDLERDAIPGRFPLIAAFEVLEHLRDPLATLGKLAAALEPGGRLLVSLPNEFHLARRLAVLAGCAWIRGDRPGAAWAGHRTFGGHDDPHLRHFTPALAERLFAAAGLAVIGRAFAGLAPPRRKALAGLSRRLAALRPSLFAIAGVFLLAPSDGGPR